MAAPLRAAAGPVVDRAPGLSADHARSLRQRFGNAPQQDQVGVWQTDQSGARGGGAYQEGGSHQGYSAVNLKFSCFHHNYTSELCFPIHTQFLILS